MITVVNIRDKGVRTALKAGDPRYVYCGRANRRYGVTASKWANPFPMNANDERGEVIAKYRVYIARRPDLLAALPELHDKALYAGASRWRAIATC